MGSLEEQPAPRDGLKALVEEDEAVRVLDGLERDGGMAPARLATARSAYENLRQAALLALSGLSAVQQRVTQLLSQLQRVQAEQEAALAGSTDPAQLLDKFRGDRELARLEAAKAADSEEAARGEAEALQQRLLLLNGKLSDAEDRRRAELAPDILLAQEDVELLHSQLDGERAKAVAAQQEVDDIALKLDTLQLEVEGLRAALGEEQEAVKAVEGAPGRARHQADLATAALRQMREEEAEVMAQLRTHEVAELAVLQESKELVQQHTAAARAVDRLRSRAGVREREVEELARDVELAKIETEKLLAEQVAWDLEVEKKTADAKREGDAAKSEQRGCVLVQRRLNRAELEGKRVAEEIPGLRNAIRNTHAHLVSEQRAGAREAAGAEKLQAELASLVEQVAGEKQLTTVQTELVKACMVDVEQLGNECTALKEAAAERDAAIRAAMSQREASMRLLNQQLQRLGEVIAEAEIRDGELEELHKKKVEARVGHRELRDLCGLMAGQMGRFQTVLGYARRNAEDLEEKVQAAEEELRTLKTAAEGRGRHAAEAEKARAGSQSDRATLAAQLSAARRAAAGVAEAADAAGIELRLAGREAEERQEVCKRLRANASAAMAAKQAIQLALLSRNEEMCGLFEQSAAVQEEVAAGPLSLQHCGDDVRVLQLEVAELQRRLDATHRSTPNVVAYDRQIASLKADVLRARREAEGLGDALESPADSAERCRMLPGELPTREDLESQVAKIEERLAARKDLSAQKEGVLEELEALTEGLLAQAGASHYPALQLSMRTNEARRAQQQLTRRMMAAVSELSLYQALSLKCAADREALKSQLAAAQLEVAAGRPPTAGAEQEYERMERDRAAEAEVRAQAAELRQLKAAGMLGVLRSTASPRPQAYIPEELGVPKPFPGLFRPFKPTEPALALAAQQQQPRTVAPAGMAAPRSGGACCAGSPGGSRPATCSPEPLLAGM